MDLTGKSAAFLEHVCPRLLAPSAELLLDALPELPHGVRALEVGASVGVLSRALSRRLLDAEPKALVLLAREELGPLPDAPAFVSWVQGTAQRLPFADGGFDLVAGNLVLGARAYDAARVAAMRRVLAPGGAAVASVLLQGSFEEVLDVLLEVSEQLSDVRLRAAVMDARSQPYDEAALRELFEEQGFTLEAFGVEERAVLHGAATEAAADPLLFDGLADAWLRIALDERVAQEANRFLETYYGGEPLTVRVRTAVVRARAPR